MRYVHRKTATLLILFSAVVGIFTILLILFTVLGETHTKSQTYATLSDSDIQGKLTRNFEQNADELMELIKEGRFAEVEAFIDYVIRNELITRDGIRYFRALLGYWFYSLERPSPLPVEIIPSLNKWIKIHPQNAIPYIMRGALYVAYAWEGDNWAIYPSIIEWWGFHKRMKKAYSDFLKASKLDPLNPYATRQLLRIYMHISDNRELMETFFQNTVSLDPNFFWAYRSKLEQLMPKWGGSLSAVFQFAQETEKNAPPKTLLPLILVLAHKEAAARSGNKKEYYADTMVWGDIERIYKRVIGDFPQSGRWKTEFGYIAYDAGKFELAKQYLTAAFESDPYNLKTCFAIAWLYQTEEQWELQEQYAKSLTELYPQYALGYSFLGYALGQQKKYQKAVESYTAAIELTPLVSRNWSSRGFYYNWLEKFEDAVADCTKAIKLDESNAFAYKQRGYAYNRQGKNQKAEVDHKMYEKLTKDY
ncbi:MAG: tetratricopeptide repeat protein [Candidatus Cloacimonetes bacterium]|nr:tetratricopeptide repeat protein [Candidatus Cloacimonadota bacterium]